MLFLLNSNFSKKLMLPSCSRSRQKIRLAQTALIVLNKKKFSTNTPNPEQNSWFRQRMLNFVNNTNKQQEKLLVCHALVVTAAILFFTRDLKLIGLTLLFLVSLFLIFVISKNLNKQVAGSVVVLLLCYLEHFYILAFYFYLLLISYTKKLYLAEASKENLIYIYLKDVETMNYHLNLEFLLFYRLQNYNIYLLISYIYSRYLDANGAIPVTPIWTESLFMQAQFLVFIVFTLNHLLFCTIRLIIPRYCNPKINMLPGSDLTTILIASTIVAVTLLAATGSLEAPLTLGVLPKM